LWHLDAPKPDLLDRIWRGAVVCQNSSNESRPINQPEINGIQSEVRAAKVKKGELHYHLLRIIS
jgi:hypothetical protein